MIRNLYAIIFLSLPYIADAQTYRVQSGDHFDFTRLVIYSGNIDNWEIGRVDGGYELRTGNAEGSFDLSSVFDLIKRNRLRGIDNRGDGRLFLAVDCPCNLDAFVVPQGYVLDIRDGEPSVTSEYERLLADWSSFGHPSASEPEELLILEQRLVPESLQTRWLVPRADLDPLGQWAPLSSETTYTAPANTTVINDELVQMPFKSPNHDRVAELEISIIEQLGLAAAQGLLVADLEQTERRLAEVLPQTPNEFNDLEVSVDLPELVTNNTFDHVNFETAIDRGSPKPPLPDSTTLVGDACLPDELFEVSAWGVDSGDNNGFFVGRTSIVGEFDAVDLLELETLVKRYLFLTFGAESKALLDAFGVDVKNRDIYSALAEIMDSGSSSGSALHYNQVECNSKVAFWALLANPIAEQRTNIAREAVLSAFTELPLHLRRHLGPFLAQRYLALGDTETASEISNLLDRAPGDPGSYHTLLNAEIDIRSGDISNGVNTFERIFRLNGPGSAEAFVRMIDESIDHGVSLPASSTLSAAALATESKGTHTGTELVRIQLRADANSGRILEAIRSMQKLENSGELGPDQALKLRKEFLNLAAEDLNDAEFIESVFATSPDLGEGPDATFLRRRIAARLIDIGLTSKARTILSKNADTDSESDLLLIARAYLRESDPVGALVQLNGLNSDQALQLKANAFEMLSDLDQLRATLEQLNDTKNLHRLDWQTQNWQGVANGGPGFLRNAALLAISGLAPDESATGQLAMSSAMLVRSASTRETLSNLLNSIDIP